MSSSVFIPIQESPPSYHRVKLDIVEYQEHQMKVDVHHTRNDTIEVMEKVEGKQNKTENSNNCQDTGQRYRKLGISRSPKDKRKQDKAVDFTAYLPPVRAPGGKKLKGKRKKNRLKDPPRTETSDFSDKVLKLPPIDPNAQSTIESSASPRKSTVTTRRINDDDDNDGLERNSSKNQKGIFAFRQRSCGKVMFSVVSVSHSVCPQERSHVTIIHDASELAIHGSQP